jgi:glycosyltransferase involved in cell wall biosynthesis
MARIGLDIRYCSDHFPGIGRVTYELARALGELAHGHELLLLHAPGLENTRFDIGALAAHPATALVEIPYGPFAPAMQWYGPLLARKLRLDLLHTPYYVAPYFGLPCPSLVTIHDIIGHRFPEQLSPRGRLFFEATMRLAIRSAARVLTVSHSARADLMAAYGLRPERVTAIPWGVHARFAPQGPAKVAALRARYGLPERYLLYLGANKPHKNLERLLRAWEWLHRERPGLLAEGWTLVLAGHRDPRHDADARFVAERRVPGVRLLGDVADADLPALYSGAGAFVFASYYEGFGLPPLEAMACGAPVLCADASALPEVVGDAALLVDPFSFQAIGASLARLLEDASLREELRARGLRRAGAFSWRRAAQETLKVYEEVL